jgi:hypothetical protein
MTVRLNALPLALTPGVALVGFLLGGKTGTLIALGGWILLLALGTLLAVWQQWRQRRADAGRTRPPLLPKRSRI